MAMTEYQIDQKTHPGKTTVDDLVKNIKKIAFECTSRPECRCPEGYFKTRDGTECLKFSESTANCMEAEKACDADFNSRLAIAKDQARLDKIAGIMEEIAGEDEFYWFGLSYNKTSNNGDADWRWSDGNKASGELVDDLNMQLKKSGRLNADTRMLDIEFNDQTPVERVAISSKQHGKYSETSRDLRLLPTTLNSSSSSTILDSPVSALSSARSRSASTMANLRATSSAQKRGQRPV